MEYVSEVGLEINGQRITDFKSVTEDAVTVRKPIKLMKKTGIISVTPQHGLKLAYAIPKDSAEFDFCAVADGTITIDYENGKRIKYTGVYCTEIGETTYDGGDDGAIRNISFVATKKS